MKNSLKCISFILLVIVLLIFVFYSEIIKNKYSSLFYLKITNSTNLAYKNQYTKIFALIIPRVNEEPNKSKHVTISVSTFQSTTIIPYINKVKLISLKHSFRSGILINDYNPLKIYVHYSSDLISGSILQSGSWESHLVAPFKDYITTNPGIQVLDAGSNLGVYTLTAAAMGCRVVAIDANIENTNRLAQSLIVNNITRNATVLLNAISNQRNEFILSRVVSNIGGQNVIESKTDPNRVKAIIMDDLIPLFDKTKPILIKIDIEGKEIDAFANATRFFNELNVKLVVIEWFLIKTNSKIGNLIQFLTNRNFLPYESYNRVGLLSSINYKNWPIDVVWIKM